MILKTTMIRLPSSRSDSWKWKGVCQSWIRATSSSGLGVGKSLSLIIESVRTDNGLLLRVRPDRICPGKELAESTMFIAISMTAAVFNISKAKDESGQIIEPVAEFSPGLLGYVVLYNSTTEEMLMTRFDPLQKPPESVQEFCDAAFRASHRLGQIRR